METMTEEYSGSLKEITNALQKFAQDRDWDQFHTPKNLVIALTGELGELCEHLQWETSESLKEKLQDPQKRTAVSDEIADVLSYLLRLSDKLGIDPAEAFWKKLSKNAEKYPVDAAKGSSKKYSDL